MKSLKLKWDNLTATCKTYLQNGLSTHKVSLSLSAGLVIGIIPLPGTTIILCILAALVFKLNHVLIQTINMLVYPVQLLLLLPFYRLGTLFFLNNDKTIIPLSFSNFSIVNMWQLLGKSTGSALMLWVIISFPIGFMAYFLVKKGLNLNKIEKLL